jgi:hypothetical protein
MDIVYINGGLGNQAFQYIFARYIEETKKSRVYIDDMHYFVVEDDVKHNISNKPANTADKIEHNGYELEYVFPYMQRPLLLSEQFDLDVWEYMVNKAKNAEALTLSVAQQLLENGADLTLIIEAVDSVNLDGLNCPLILTPGNRFNSAVTTIPSDIYYYGFWINPGWLNNYRDVLLKDFTFRPIEDSQNKLYENEIRGSFAIGVHIRRGDFVRFGFALPESYYYSIIAEMANKHPEATYFIFSDDLEWCKKNREALGIPEKKSIYVEGNYDYKNNYIDLQLMAMCNVLIAGISSFSYLASLLNQTPGFYSIKAGERNPDDLAGGLQRVVVT